jgi:anti-sigma factor RsiW
MNLDDPNLSALIREHATRHAAPEDLSAAIRTQVALAEAGRSATPLPAAAPAPGRRWFDFAWRPAALSFALGLACSFIVMPIVQRVEFNEPVDAELVADHVRALQLGTVTEVVSTDRHTVKPWFQGRLDFAPPVFDLATEGFPLMGGRVEHVRGQVVATLAYARNRHVIDVFVWPSTAQQAPVRSQRKGFNVMHWADGSMQYWAVSDLERTDMERFTQLWLEKVAAQ